MVDPAIVAIVEASGVPIGTLSSRTLRVFWWMTLGLFWAALGLPLGIFFPLAVAVLGCMSAAVDVARTIGDALAGRKYDVMSPIRSVVVHRRAIAVAVVAIGLLVSGVGLRISFFLAQPIAKPIAWRIWAVEPAPVRTTYHEPLSIRMVGPYLCVVSNTPAGLRLRIIGSGTITVTEDANGDRRYEVFLYEPYHLRLIGP